MRYDYRCEKCGVMELMHSMKVSLKKCPDCGGKIEKLFSQNFGIIKTGRPVYSYNRVLKYKTCKNNDEPRRKVNKKTDGKRGVNRQW